jgi:hypothetical protein
VVTPYFDTSLVSFDVDFANASPVSFEFRVEESDLLQPIALNAILRNFTGQGIAAYTLVLDKGSFATVGTVTRQFGGQADVVQLGGQIAQLHFNSPEFLDVEVGNALGTTIGTVNWTLQGLQAGDRVNVTVAVGAVPEPETYAFLLAGLAVVGATLRRRAA